MFPLWLLLVARGTLAEGLAFPISYNILEALFVGSPGENILLFSVEEFLVSGTDLTKAVRSTLYYYDYYYYYYYYCCYHRPKRCSWPGNCFP